MNILLINHYAGSNIHGMEYRPFYLAREWVKSGHKVSIITASYSHLRSKEPTINGNMTKEVIEGIQYVWIKTPRYQGRGFGRIFNMMKFSLMLLIKKSEITHECNPEMVIASSPHPFIFYGAYKIAQSSGARLIFEVRDLWPLSLIEVGQMSSYHPFMLMMQWIENFAYHKSDRVVSLLPKCDGYMIEHGMASHKFVYVPNGMDVTEWQKNKIPLPQYHSKVLSEIKQEGRFIVGYTGAHGIPNALHTLIEAAFLLQSEPVTIILVGKGQEKRSLQQKVSQLGLKNVIFLPPIEKSAIPSFLYLMDALFIGWLRSPVYRFGISPNKLLDYMMSGKPVIHAVSAGNDLVEDSGCGLSVPPENPEAIAQAILCLKEMGHSQRMAMGLNGKRYVISNYDYRVIAKNFIEKIND